jgi:hypothetical protein
MAGADLNLSRRALLGAACALPALAAGAGATLTRHPELVSGSSSPPALPHQDGMLKQVQHDEKCAVTLWNRALARLRRAEAALAATETADEDAYDRLAGRCDAAMCRLLRTPAPNCAALAAKLELTVRHLVWELSGGEACLAALTRDARRLAQRHG